MKDADRYSLASRMFYGFWWMAIRIVLRVLFRLKITGAEHERRKGRVIYASNHISALDPPVVGASVRRQLTFLAKRELFQIPIFRTLIWWLHARPVNRTGYTRGVLELLRVRLEHDGAVLLFPEGTRQRDGRLGKGKIGVGMLAVWTGAPVIPVYVCGTASPLKSLVWRSRFWVAMAPAIEPPDATTPTDRKRAYQTVTDQVMDSIARLKAVVDQQMIHHASTAQAAQAPAGDGAHLPGRR